MLIVAQQTGLSANSSQHLDQLLLDDQPDRRSLLLNLALEMGLLRQADEGLRTARTAVDWLRQSREAQLRSLADAWSSSRWNDLCHTPGLRCEGDNWENDPLLARAGLLDALPRSTDWFPMQPVIHQLKANNPDFQRPDGNYDTWYVRDVQTGAFVNGFHNWDVVEGRLLAFMIEGPLTWLGLAVTVATPDGPLYSLTERMLAWLNETPPADDEVRVPLVVQPDGILEVPHSTDRYHRFQAARISEALPVTSKRPFRYRITPSSLEQAQEQGITPDRILQFLETASGRPLPAGVKRGINRWGERGVEGKLDSVVVLRVREAGILETLRQNPKTRDYIGESFGDLVVSIRADQWPALRQAAAQLGLLLDVNVDE